MRSKPTGAYVLDSWAILALVGNELGAERVEAVLDRAEASKNLLLLSIINAGEVYYRLLKTGKRDLAEEFVGDLRRHRLPIRLVPATNTRVWRAAQIKAEHAIAYADAFAAALAQEAGCAVLTGDPEFAALGSAGICRVAWIGRAYRPRKLLS